jgi:hypothetical protein
LLTRFAFENHNLLCQQKICWFPELLTELVFIHAFV